MKVQQIYTYKREVFVCLFVCLLPFGAQTTEGISAKIGMELLQRSSKNFFGSDPLRSF